MIINIIIQTGITIIGWIVLYYLAIKKNKRIKKKEITTEYLIEALRRFEKASNRTDNKYLNEIETAIADIQFFGTKQQIILAQEFVEEFSKTKKGNSLELIIELRESLRKELGLERVPNKFRFLRCTS